MSGVTLDDADTGVVCSGQWYAYTSWSSAYKGTNYLSERQSNPHFPR